jgi:hypothetical protein
VELLFPRDDKISYGKERNNKNWAAVHHEYASCSWRHGNKIEATKQLTENKWREQVKGPTCNPKNRTSGGLNPFLEHLINKLRWGQENKSNPCNENDPYYKLETPLGP